MVRKETVVYLERPGLRNLCLADVSLSKRLETLPIPSGVVLWLTACSDLSVRTSDGEKNKSYSEGRGEIVLKTERGI